MNTFFEIADLGNTSKCRRPFKDYDEKDERAKRQTVSDTLEREENNPVLLEAARRCATMKEEKDLAKMIKQVIANQNNTKSMLKSLKDTQLQPLKMTAEEGLALLLDLGSSKRQYNMYRSVVNQFGAKIFPSYLMVLVTKNNASTRFANKFRLCKCTVAIFV